MHYIASAIAASLGYSVEYPTKGLAVLTGSGKTLVFRHFLSRGLLTSTISDGGRIVLRNPSASTAGKALKELGY